MQNDYDFNVFTNLFNFVFLALIEKMTSHGFWTQKGHKKLLIKLHLNEM